MILAVSTNGATNSKVPVLLLSCWSHLSWLTVNTEVSPAVLDGISIPPWPTSWDFQVNHPQLWMLCWIQLTTSYHKTQIAHKIRISYMTHHITHLLAAVLVINIICLITIHHHTSPYITIHHHTSPYITIYHHTSPYITIHHHTSPYITIYHHISMSCCFESPIFSMAWKNLPPSIPSSTAPQVWRFFSRCVHWQITRFHVQFDALNPKFNQWE